MTDRAAIADTMRAARFDAATRTLSVQDVPVPVPGPGEALVKVAACGICHSDLGQLLGYIKPVLDAVTPGHEASGTVASVGAGVTGWSEGDRVVLAAGRSCGQCPACRSSAGLDSCERLQLMAFDYDGAWAEYVAVPAAALVRVPESIPLEQAAVLADAVSTPYGAVVETGAVRPAEAVGIWGLGGLGTHAVQIARLCGASPIIALDPLPAARERALKLGADAALDPADEATPRRIKELTGGRGLRAAFDCVGKAAFDCVGKAASFTQAEAALGHRGRLVLVGLSPDRLDLGPELAFTVKRHTVIGHLGYRKQHMEELVELVARGRLDLSGSVSEILPLEEIQEGVRKLKEYEGNPIRIIVRP